MVAPFEPGSPCVPDRRLEGRGDGKRGGPFEGGALRYAQYVVNSSSLNVYHNDAAVSLPPTSNLWSYPRPFSAVHVFMFVTREGFFGSVP